MCLCGTAWCWVEMPWSFPWFLTCHPLIILPYHHWNVGHTVWSHLGNHQVASQVCPFSLLRQSFSSCSSVTGVGSAVLLSLLLLRGSSVQFVAVSQDHHLTDALPAFQVSSSRGVWARFPWLGTCLTFHISHLPQLSRFCSYCPGQVPNFRS